MVMKKKQLIGSSATLPGEAEGAGASKPAAPSAGRQKATAKQLAVAKLATAKLLTAKLQTLKRLT